MTPEKRVLNATISMQCSMHKVQVPCSEVDIGTSVMNEMMITVHSMEHSHAKYGLVCDDGL